MIRYIYFLCILISLSGCGSRKLVTKEYIRLKGSDTMKVLACQWADAYMTLHPNSIVLVEGGGSSTGFKGLIEGSVDIALASRIIRPIEAGKMAEKYKSIGLSFMVAKDALSIYLNKNNKITTLTIGDLALIFNGRISNWLVFTDRFNPIIPVTRPETSGTQLFFRRHVLKGAKYSDKIITLATTKDISTFVAKNKNAIGFGGIAYGDSVFHAPINGIYPTSQTVKNDTYPLTRYLYFYTIDTPSNKVRKFIDWVISPAGQLIVSQVGYIPLWGE
jgi:phosphate transport system substrate-binding protein